MHNMTVVRLTILICVCVSGSVSGQLQIPDPESAMLGQSMTWGAGVCTVFKKLNLAVFGLQGAESEKPIGTAFEGYLTSDGCCDA